MNLSLKTAARIAWRETRSSMTKFLFVVLAVAAGVGALSGVRGFSESFRSTLTREARTVMAADLAARQFSVPNPSQLAQLDALAPEGIEHTWITETVSMASSTATDSTPVLAASEARTWPCSRAIQDRATVASPGLDSLNPVLTVRVPGSMSVAASRRR